jgi:hypothetical protein
MSFSLAHIASSKTGLTIIDAYGYQANWFVMGSLGFSRCIWLQKLVQKKKTIPIVILWAPPLLKGAKLRTDRALQQCGRAIRSAMADAIPHAAPFPEQRICIKDLSFKINSEKKAKQKTKYLVK